MKNKKKIVIIITGIFLLFILLFPIKLFSDDGGTIEYKAILYTVIKRHSIVLTGSSIDGYYIGTEIKILFFEVYNDVEFVPMESGDV